MEVTLGGWLRGGSKGILDEERGEKRVRKDKGIEREGWGFSKYQKILWDSKRERKGVMGISAEGKGKWEFRGR